MDPAEWTRHQATIDPKSYPSWLTTTELLDLDGGVRGYFDYLAGLCDTTQPAPPGFDPEALWTPDETATQPAKRIMSGLSKIDRFSRAPAEVAMVTGLSVDDLLVNGRGCRGNPARWVLGWWLLHDDHMPTEEVGSFLCTRPSTVSKMARKARSRRNDIPILQSWMTQLEHGVPIAGNGTHMTA